MEDKVSGNAAVETAESNPAPVKKANKSKAKAQQQQQQQQQQQKKVSSRPPTSEMVTAAIKELKDRKGSSFQAIKKYIVSTYKMDSEKVAPFIKRYLKSAVSAGVVVQTKGKGATGSFKLSTDKPKSKSTKGKAQRASLAHTDAKTTKKDTRVEKTTTARKAVAAKKPVAAKKAAASLKKQPAQKTAAKTPTKRGKAAEPKSPSKAKKAVKAPAAKTKTPKPKKTTATKSVKAAAKK